MSAAHVLIGLALGALGAGAHLAITSMRVRAIARGQHARALALLPLGFFAVGGAVWLAARIAAPAAWASLPGVLAVHLALVLFARSRT